jgi:hypothetical protein
MKTHPNLRRAFVARLPGTVAMTGIAAIAPQNAAANDAARAPHHHRNGNAVVHWNSVAGDAFAPSQGTEENGMSRLNAGIHLRHAVKDGRRQGRSVGQSVAKALAPIR